VPLIVAAPDSADQSARQADGDQPNQQV